MYSLIWKIYTLICKIHTLICTFYTLIWKIYTLICKIYTLICKIHTLICKSWIWPEPAVHNFERVSSSNLSDCSYVKIHIPHATKCFWPVRESVGNVFVSDSPLKLLNGISWNMVVFKDMTWRYAYRQEIFIRLFF